MTRYFVLDENIIILAQKGENAQGKRDITCLQLIQAIAANDHALVMGKSFWGKYSSQTKTLERQRILLIPRVMTILQSVLLDLNRDNKFIADDELQEIEGLEQLAQSGVDIGDRDFVRAAASVPGSILVTADAPLMIRIREQGFDQQYNFSVLPPQAALLLVPFAGKHSAV